MAILEFLEQKGTTPPRDIAYGLDWPLKRTKNWLAPLREAGLIEPTVANRRSKDQAYRLTERGRAALGQHSGTDASHRE